MHLPNLGIVTLDIITQVKCQALCFYEILSAFFTYMKHDRENQYN